MSTEQTFGAWLLAQGDRSDTTGTLARAWKALKEARGYKHNNVKSIREMLSAQYGEDWQRLDGEAAITSAEVEWKTGKPNPAQSGGSAQQEQPGGNPGTEPEPVQTTIFDLPAAAAALLEPTPPLPSTPQFAVLVVDGREFELTAGRRYVIDFGAPVVRDIEGFTQPLRVGAFQTTQYAEQERAAAQMMTDGRLDWNALFGGADHNLPDGIDLVTLGLPDEE